MEELYALKIKALWKQFWSEHFSFWMICGYLFFEYVRPQSLVPAIDFLPWAQLFLLGAIGGWFGDKKAKWTSVPANAWMVLFLIFTVASVFTASYPEVSKKHFNDYFSWFVVYFALVLTGSTRKRLYILILIFVFASFKISFSLARVWTMRGFSFTKWGLQGPPGFFTNSGELAIQMLVYAPIAYYFFQSIAPWLTAAKPKRWMFGLMPITAAMTILGSSSRGGQIGMIYQIYAMFLRGKLSIRNILLVGLIGFAGYALLPDAQKERFASTGKDKTSEQRLLYWQHGWEMIKEHPLLGVGFFNFIPYYEAHYAGDMLYEHAELPHNIFIQIGTDSGFLGLFAYIALIWQVFANGRVTKKNAAQLGGEGLFLTNISKGLDAGTIGFLIAGQFVTVGYYPFLWVNLAFSSCLRIISQREVAALSAR